MDQYLNINKQLKQIFRNRNEKQVQNLHKYQIKHMNQSIQLCKNLANSNSIYKTNKNQLQNKDLQKIYLKMVEFTIFSGSFFIK